MTALASVSEHLRAAVRGTGSNEPEVGIDQRSIFCGGGGTVANTGGPDVAIVFAVFARIWDTVAACIDDHHWVEVRDGKLHVVGEHVNVVELVVGAIRKIAKVLAADLTLMLSIEAVIVVGTRIFAIPRTHMLSKRLVVGHVGSKAA